MAIHLGQSMGAEDGQRRRLLSHPNHSSQASPKALEARQFLEKLQRIERAQTSALRALLSFEKRGR
jgi:hypothetical protein